MLPINASSIQHAQAAQQPLKNSSKNFDTTLKVTGIALTVLAAGAILAQVPADLFAGLVLVGFAALTCLCIAALADSSSAGSSLIYTPSHRPRAWTFSRPHSPFYYRQPVILPPRVISLPAYRPAPMPARGIDPRPMREHVGIHRR